MDSSPNEMESQALSLLATNNPPSTLASPKPKPKPVIIGNSSMICNTPASNHLVEHMSACRQSSHEGVNAEQQAFTNTHSSVIITNDSSGVEHSLPCLTSTVDITSNSQLSGFDSDWIRSHVNSNPLLVKSDTSITNDSVMVQSNGVLPKDCDRMSAGAMPRTDSTLISDSSSHTDEYHVVPTANAYHMSSPSAVTSGRNSHNATAPLATLPEFRHIDNSPSPPSSKGCHDEHSDDAHSDDCPGRRQRACISLQHLFDIEASVAALTSQHQMSEGDCVIMKDDNNNIDGGYINPLSVIADDDIERRSEAQSLISYDASPWKQGCRVGGGTYPSPSATSFSTITSEGPICRICHEGEQGGYLISPCHCTGTLRYLHKKCLEQWLQTRNKDVCELCNFEIRTRRRTRPFREWFRHPLNPRDRRNFAVDFLCGLILSPLVVISAWLCLNGSAHYVRHAERSLEGLGLILLAVILIAIFSTWASLTGRYHLMVWREWRKQNQLVTVLMTGQPILPASHSPSMNTIQSRISLHPPSLNANHCRVSPSVSNGGSHIEVKI